MFHDRKIIISSIVAITINILLWIILLGKFGLSAAEVPLHYNVVYGIDFVGSARLLYQLPLIGLIVLLVNLWLGSTLYEDRKYFSYVLIITAGLVQVFLLVPVVALVVINS